MAASNNKIYSYFDHTIESQIDLSELRPAGSNDGSPSVYIRLAEPVAYADRRYGWCHQWKTDEGGTTLSLAKNNNTYCLEIPGSTKFEISGDGKQLVCIPKLTTPLVVTRHLLLDQILPRLFAHFHNYNVFHGSCVIKGDTGICFLGETGRGKSTLAAGFLQAGYSVLTDDCIRLFINSGQVFGIPSYNGMRLLNDSRKALNLDAGNQEGAVSLSKAKFRITLSHPRLATTKIKQIYFLVDPEDGERGEHIKILKVSKSVAVKELLRNSFSLDVSDAKYLKNQFLHIVEIVSTGLPIYFLHYPRSYEAIPEIIQTVER